MLGFKTKMAQWKRSNVPCMSSYWTACESATLQKMEIKVSKLKKNQNKQKNWFFRIRNSRRVSSNLLAVCFFANFSLWSVKQRVLLTTTGLRTQFWRKNTYLLMKFEARSFFLFASSRLWLWRLCVPVSDAVWSDTCNDVSKKAVSITRHVSPCTLIYPHNAGSSSSEMSIVNLNTQRHIPEESCLFKIFWFWTLTILPGPPHTAFLKVAVLLFM